MTAYYIVKIKKCILMMVKMRVYERAIGVRPSERDHYVNLREEIRRRVEGLWGRGGMIRELWKPATDVTATKVTHTDDYLDERINEV
jgi:hypothetical protein